MLMDVTNRKRCRRIEPDKPSSSERNQKRQRLYSANSEKVADRQPTQAHPYPDLSSTRLTRKRIRDGDDDNIVPMDIDGGDCTRKKPKCSEFDSEQNQDEKPQWLTPRNSTRTAHNSLHTGLSPPRCLSTITTGKDTTRIFNIQHLSTSHQHIISSVQS
eukprot:808556_1